MDQKGLSSVPHLLAPSCLSTTWKHSSMFSVLGWLLIVRMYPEHLQLSLYVNLIFDCVTHFLAINDGSALLVNTGCLSIPDMSCTSPYFILTRYLYVEVNIWCWKRGETQAYVLHLPSILEEKSLCLTSFSVSKVS